MRSWVWLRNAVKRTASIWELIIEIDILAQLLFVFLLGLDEPETKSHFGISLIWNRVAYFLAKYRQGYKLFSSTKDIRIAQELLQGQVRQKKRQWLVEF
jgi:hypothetical protein